jgi:peptidoglycan/xylan/chitin deacetylase (PgdA/CDA1 family)
MKTQAITLAARAKGPFSLVKRVRSIASRYGLTPDKMNRALDLFVQTLERFDCGATFPITAVTLKRNPELIARYLDRNIEFAVHGYTHIDYAQLAPEQQLTHLLSACRVFSDTGIKAVGFRSPYLRRETHLTAALMRAGFEYVSNQPIMWEVVESETFSPSSYASYERAISFYAPWRPEECLSLPRLENQLVEIPVSLPDDEMLLDRLGGEAQGLVDKVWQRILLETHQRGELFTIQLHPERIALCEGGLSAVLTEARQLSPPVWLARLDEIAGWWRSRTETSFKIAELEGGAYHFVVAGPNGTSVLIRAAETDAPTLPWADNYRQLEATAFTIHAPLRPLIGISPDASPKLINFLIQQGYLVEISHQRHRYSHYVDATQFTPGQERRLLAQIENGGGPLVRLGRWPNNARSALAVTGDIDALTLWDYSLRLVGN